MNNKYSKYSKRPVTFGQNGYVPSTASNQIIDQAIEESEVYSDALSAIAIVGIITAIVCVGGLLAIASIMLGM